jgi:hypothetical protein
MTETVFSRIIASVLLLVDAIMGKFVTAPTWTSGNLENCTIGGYSGGALTDCGTALVAQIPQLAVGGIGFLNGILAALNLVDA